MVLIDQADAHTLVSAARGCGNSKNRLSVVGACWWERGEYRLAG